MMFISVSLRLSVSVLTVYIIHYIVRFVNPHICANPHIRKETMMLKNLRGYNVQYATYKTRQRERGLDGPPNTLDVIRGDPSTELDYEQFCTALEQAGVNWLRVKIVGRNNPQGGLVCAFEPPPAGTYNLWNIVLDPASLREQPGPVHPRMQTTWRPPERDPVPQRGIWG
jgi:hypothetical protein